MRKSQYEVEVLVNGKPLKEYFAGGRTYVEGRKGTTFSLRLRNNSWQRKLFIPSIDGLSVMNGKDASFDSSGYIVKPNSAITIDGWRISDQEVAEFYFSSPNESYRKRMEKGNNLGVIGVAVFAEKEKPPVIYNTFPHVHCRCIGPCFHSTYTTSTSGGGGGGIITLNASASNLSAKAESRAMFASQDLGTGWGENKRSEVISVEFERASQPEETFEIYYNTRKQLEAMGINLHKEGVYITPQAFPGQYCEPPKN